MDEQERRTLMAELERRVEARQKAGDYEFPWLDTQVESQNIEAIVPDHAPQDPSIRLRPEHARSTTAIVGRPLTAVKRGLLRLLRQPIDDLAAQADAAVRHALGEARSARMTAHDGIAAAQRGVSEVKEGLSGVRRDGFDVQQRLATSEGADEWARSAVAAEAAAREAAQREARTFLLRIEEIEQTLEHLQLPSRLARLERIRQIDATPAAIAPSLSPSTEPPLDYLAFEARFRGSEKAIRARQQVYVDLLAGRRQVVDLGCGRGELVTLLAEAAIPAYGVDTNADFVDLLAEKGLKVVRQDLMRHLEELSPGDVDGIVLSHVVEHLPPHVVSHLIETAWQKLPEGGLLIMETPNPESLVAGSINFHRDPTHLRPVHPDTLSFICESTGFSSVEIRRQSPVPDSDRLPLAGSEAGPLAAHLDRVVGRLNELIYGFQDYAVVARR
jgi:2-polyprenyl-3-methyl-5-hydroxy-6-metoxy-1,4-benzoquinol methylase